MNMKSQEPVVYELDLCALFESAMDRRLGQDPATQEKTRTVQNYAKKERDELKGLIDKILEDGVLDAEERLELGHLEHLESMTSELFDKVNLENPELAQEFEAAGEQFRQKLIALVRKGKTKEESVMKKSELMKIIREEVEVVLTNEEAVEIFNLDPAALIDEMLKEEDLSAAERRALPDSDFALPGKGEGPEGKQSGSYPIPDAEHARMALAMVAKHGTAEEKAKVRAAVKKKFPDIDQGKD
jgi:hypothetical protein